MLQCTLLHHTSRTRTDNLQRFRKQPGHDPVSESTTGRQELLIITVLHPVDELHCYKKLIWVTMSIIKLHTNPFLPCIHVAFPLRIEPVPTPIPPP